MTIASANWAPTDWRKAAAERRDREVVEQLLRDKATALSGDGVSIVVRVLNTKI